jgi:preprotein translocase subunit SecA
MPSLNFVGAIFRKIFGSQNERLLKVYNRNVVLINSFESKIRGDYDTRFAAAMKQFESAGVDSQPVAGEKPKNSPWTAPTEAPAEDRVAEIQKIRVELSSDLREYTAALRERLAGGEPPESVLPEGFAVLREASRRAQNHRHFDCQLVGGQVLYEGKISEMKTGEGKTIVCHLAAYMRCLEGKKVHIVTVNDYLVQRDAEFARPIFELVGLSVGYIQSQLDPGGREGIRAAAYGSNITYGTNNEFGFDYLRDNMKTSLEEQVQGPLDFAIIDEVDSILIDEARTPLIISGAAADDVTRYRTADAVARTLIQKQTTANSETTARLKEWGDNAPKQFTEQQKFGDAIRKFKSDPNWLSEDEATAIGHQQYYIVQRERKQVSVTHDGITVAQDQLGLGSLYVGANMEWPHLIENSVRAHVTYERDVDYVVKDGEVIIVDSFTGRLMHGRQWSDGLHQSVEAKESVRVKEETQTLATITLQNFFKLYTRIAGMTGTAMTEADEFMKIYKLDVVAIPTNRPVNRQDFHDRIYKTVEDKYDAIVEEIHDIHSKGRPNDPFVLEPVLKNLIPILQKHGKSPERIQNALAKFDGGNYKDAKEDTLTAFRECSRLMSEAYDDAMGDLARGRPVLVGTISVENSEKLSNTLTRKYGIEHEVLNAKQHAREAEIVKKAGEKHPPRGAKGAAAKNDMQGNVTIATNMAGRGTDIKLQQGVVYEKCVGDLGPPPNANGHHYAWNEVGVIGTKCCINCPDYDPKTNCAHCWKPKIDPRFPEMGRKVCPSIVPCGLHIIGTERHESRRIDNQLRGRSGRQGDPGSSRFFLSLGDDLLKMFMGEWTLKMLERMGFEQGMAIEAKSINKGIERAQKKVEEKNFSSRKHLLEYDEVMDHQRQVFYSQRQEILSASKPGKSAQLVTLIWKMIDHTLETAAANFLAKDYNARCIAEWVRGELEVNLDPKNIDAGDMRRCDHYVRDEARAEATTQINMTVGEYLDPDIDPKEWDIRGLHRWAETRFGSKITQNQLRDMNTEEVIDHLTQAAEKKVEEANLGPIEQYFDPEYGHKSLLQWARAKFGVEFDDAAYQNLSDADVIAKLHEQVRTAYREREVRYPVEWILERTILREGDNAYAADNLAKWANQKFGLNWTVDELRGRSVEEIASQLLQLNREFASNGKLTSEIDQAIQTHRGSTNGDLAEWGRQRFGPAFDEQSFKDAGDPRQMLLAFGQDLIRRELTFLERYVLLQIYDQAWKDHMHAMDLLKEAIGLRGFAEQDPKIAYKREGFQMFQEMMNGIEDKVTSIIFKARLSDEGQTRSRYNIAAARHAEATNQGFAQQADSDRGDAMKAQGQEQKIETIRREEPKVGRNDPCPCGSGKKFKQCHGKGQ